ncbi:unnamed protein product, partial [marine sediment metagenome]
MHSAVAEWCTRWFTQMQRPARILYLPEGPHQIGKCDVAQYDVIVTHCQLSGLDDSDVMASLWRLGYEFSAPRGVLLLEIIGKDARECDIAG